MDFLPIENRKNKLLRLVERIQTELYNNATAIQIKSIVPDNSEIEEIIKMVKEEVNCSHNPTEEKLDDDISSTESEEERNNIIKQTNICKKKYKSKRKRRSNTKKSQLILEDPKPSTVTKNLTKIEFPKKRVISEEKRIKNLHTNISYYKSRENSVKTKRTITTACQQFEFNNAIREYELTNSEEGYSRNKGCSLMRLKVRKLPIIKNSVADKYEGLLPIHCSKSIAKQKYGIIHNIQYQIKKPTYLYSKDDAFRMLRKFEQSPIKRYFRKSVERNILSGYCCDERRSRAKMIIQQSAYDSSKGKTLFGGVKFCQAKPIINLKK